MSNSALPPEIRGLTIPERMELVEQIWDSIAEDQSKFELTDAQKAELDRRLSLRDTSRVRGLDWADVKQRILGES
ncbi:MAG: addiction module protein [Pirellulaceae bacterium]